MRSLFIISLPRSLSTLVHQMCCAALGLRSPGWTTSGEIMNADRLVLTAGRGMASLKYTTSRDRDVFRSATTFLGDAVFANGFCYKDVVQPFVVGQWLREHPDMAVLKIMPNLAHVAYAMLRQNWLYPVDAAICGSNIPQRLMSGLLQAAETMESVPGEVVSYDELVFGFDPLRRALARLYPDREIGPLRQAPDFGAYRDHVLKRRTEPAYEDLRMLEERMRRDRKPAQTMGAEQLDGSTRAFEREPRRRDHASLDTSLIAPVPPGSPDAQVGHQDALG